MITIETLSKIILTIGSRETCNMSDIWREADIVYSWVWKQRKELEKAGYITTEKQGRVRNIVLTSKGKELYKVFKKMRPLLKSLEEDLK